MAARPMSPIDRKESPETIPAKEPSLEREESLGDAVNLQRLAKLSMQSHDRPWRPESKGSSWQVVGPIPLPSSVSESSSVMFSEDDSEDSEEEKHPRAVGHVSQGARSVASVGERERGRGRERSESVVSVGLGGGQTADTKIIVVGIQLKLELGLGPPTVRLELDLHSMELMDYALSRLARKGDTIIGLYAHKPGKRLPQGRTEEDLPAVMEDMVAAWEALAVPKKVRVEARVTISDKAKPAFTREAAALGAHTVLLSCSFIKFVGKQLNGVHKWADACIHDMPRECTIIVVRHGSVITSSKGRGGVKSEKRTVSRSNSSSSSRPKRKISFGEVDEATKHYGNTQLSRQGATTSNVYLGYFKDLGAGVVKRYKVGGRPSDASILNVKAELEMWTRRANSNLVGMFSVLVDKKYCVVVLDYLPQGCLYENLHVMTSQRRLSWKQRIRILRGTAEAVCFLHTCCNPPVLHGALQSMNILLDGDMEPLLTDYWMETVRNAGGGSNFFELPPGSYGAQGYLAPEIQAEAGRPSLSSFEGDVYAYGILMMELVTGKRAFEEGRKPAFLHAWLKPLLRNREYREIVDSKLFSNYDVKEVTALVDIAMACCDLDPMRRPPMEEVLRRVEDAVTSPDSYSITEPSLA